MSYGKGLIAGLLCIAPFISGCSSDAQERPGYLDAQTGKPLILANGEELKEGKMSSIPGINRHQVPDEAVDLAPPVIIVEGQQTTVTPNASRYPSTYQEDAQGTPFLIITGEYEELWQVLLQTLKRAGFTVEGADPGRGHIILKVKDISQKDQPVKKVRLVVARAYQSVRVLVQEVEQPTAVAAPLASSILKIIQASL